MKVVKIALCGKARVGKDTVADYMTLYHSFYKIAFADKLKSMAHEIFTDIPMEPKPRRLYQDFGEYCRRIDPLVWVKHVEAFVDLMLDGRTLPYFHIVVTDMRNETEARWARENGYHVVKVEANPDVRMERAVRTNQVLTPEMLAHSSELDVDKIEPDYIIDNNGTFDELYAQVEALLGALEVE